MISEIIAPLLLGLLGKLALYIRTRSCKKARELCDRKFEGSYEAAGLIYLLDGIALFGALLGIIALAAVLIMSISSLL